MSLHLHPAEFHDAIHAGLTAAFALSLLALFVVLMVAAPTLWAIPLPAACAYLMFQAVCELRGGAR